MRWLLTALLGGLVIFFAPLVWLYATTPIVTAEAARPADAALLFGAIVRDNSISPLHAERLDTGLDLYREGKVKVLVVSNAPRAAAVMAAYLRDHGVPEDRIEIDGTGEATPDTCVAEAARPGHRSVIMVSQRFHLPRIALQCRKLGVTGQYVAAMADDGSDDGAGLGAWATLEIRAKRHVREAALVWTEVLGVYRFLERIDKAVVF